MFSSSEQYFILLINASLGFGRMTSMYKKHKLMKEQFSHDFYYQIVGWEVCDEGQDHMTIDYSFGGFDGVKTFF